MTKVILQCPDDLRRTAAGMSGRLFWPHSDILADVVNVYYGREPDIECVTAHVPWWNLTFHFDDAAEATLFKLKYG